MPSTQNEQNWQAFCERVTYQGQPHLSIEPFEPAPDEIARLNERNLHVLRSLASLDERRPDNGDENDPVMLELQRMDSKLNVLMDIVDRLLMPSALLPLRQPVELNAVGVVVPQSVCPGAEHLLVRLHFDACRALPLELPALRAQPLSGDKAFICFCQLSDMVEDGLERFVFCHHRRKVAEARLLGVTDGTTGVTKRV